VAVPAWPYALFALLLAGALARLAHPDPPYAARLPAQRALRALAGLILVVVFCWAVGAALPQGAALPLPAPVPDLLLYPWQFLVVPVVLVAGALFAVVVGALARRLFRGRPPRGRVGFHREPPGS
jgi:hypothetical protein